MVSEAMRRSKTISLEEALKDYIKEMKFQDKLDEINLIYAWEEIAGKAITSRISKVYVKDNILHIKVTSSVVKNELLMLREVFRKKLNEKAGREIIKEIIIK